MRECSGKVVWRYRPSSEGPHDHSDIDQHKLKYNQSIVVRTFTFLMESRGERRISTLENINSNSNFLISEMRQSLDSPTDSGEITLV